MFSHADPRRPTVFFFFNDTATTEIYTLSLHDALPICFSLRPPMAVTSPRSVISPVMATSARTGIPVSAERSEEHTSELQSRPHLVCRLLLEKTYITDARAAVLV